MSETITKTTLTLDITNAARGQELLTGLLSYVDDMMGLNYDSIASQLDYVANYARMKRYEENKRQLYQQAAQRSNHNARR